MRKIILALSVTALCTLQACDSPKTEENKAAEESNEAKFDDTHMEEDAEFAFKAAEGGMMEVDLGNLALTNSSSATVKAFAQAMVAEHSTANDELKALAESKHITLPTSYDGDKQKKVDDLKQKTGADFDEAYIDFMVKDHKDDIDLFQKEAEKGKDADLKAWAGSKAPTLQHHLEMAENAKAELKKK